MLRQESQNCVSLAVIANYITMIYTISNLSKQGTFLKETQPQSVTLFYLTRLVNIT